MCSAGDVRRSDARSDRDQRRDERHERTAIAAAPASLAYRSAVGEANVADMMIAKNATYGGEGNGGPIDPRVGYVRDSFVGMAQVLELMTKTGKSLAELADGLPKLHIHKSKASVSPDRLPAIVRGIDDQTHRRKRTRR